MPQTPLPRPPYSSIRFSKVEIENSILKFDCAFLKSENDRLKKKIKKYKKKLKWKT